MRVAVGDDRAGERIERIDLDRFLRDNDGVCRGDIHPRAGRALPGFVLCVKAGAGGIGIGIAGRDAVTPRGEGGIVVVAEDGDPVDHDIDRAVFHCRFIFFRLLGGHEARQLHDFNRQSGKARGEILEMLTAQ